MPCQWSSNKEVHWQATTSMPAVTSSLTSPNAVPDETAVNMCDTPGGIDSRHERALVTWMSALPRLTMRE